MQALTKTNKFLKQFHQQYRNNSNQKLVYHEYGDPIKVLRIETEPLPILSNSESDSNSIIVKMLAAPLNPADLNTIEGKYPIKPPLPATPGSEGVGEIITIGSNVKHLQPGDRVIPLKRSCGTWQSHLKIESDLVKKIPEAVSTVDAATVFINPCTAYRMLRDFVRLEPGDTVIQNGANSACGQAVIQLCKQWRLKTVNVIRDRPNVGELKKDLRDLGADVVLTEEELRSSAKQLKSSLKPPQLALNCVGGKNALEISRQLAKNGIMVTYGGMAREPVTVPVSGLIFKNLTFKGFWMTDWTANADNRKAEMEMLDDLLTMIETNEFRGPTNACLVPFKEYQEALKELSNFSGKIGKKFLLSFS